VGFLLAQATLGIDTLAWTKGSTPSERSETHEGMGLDEAIRSKGEARADIGGAVEIAMDHGTATRARESAPFGYIVVDVGAMGASTG
jgi:hypothetical protein